MDFDHWQGQFYGLHDRWPTALEAWNAAKNNEPPTQEPMTQDRADLHRLTASHHGRYMQGCAECEAIKEALKGDNHGQA